MDEESENHWIAQLASGKEAAFLAFYDYFAARLYRTALAIVRDRQEAEDVVQELCMNLLRSRERLTQVRDFAAYLFTALRRAAIQAAQKRQQREATSPLLGTEIDSSSANQITQKNEAEALSRVLQQIPEEQREVVILKIHAGLTFAQIGELLGLSMHTVAGRYRYALEKLRTLLEKSP